MDTHVDVDMNTDVGAVAGLGLGLTVGTGVDSEIKGENGYMKGEKKKSEMTEMVGRRRLKFFNENYKLREGKYRLILKNGENGDKGMKNDAKYKRHLKKLRRLEKKLKKYEEEKEEKVQEEKDKNEWLDSISIAAVRKQIEQHVENTPPSVVVEMESFDFPIVWSEKERVQVNNEFSAIQKLNFVMDPGLYGKNNVERKYRKLIRGHEVRRVTKGVAGGRVIEEEIKPTLSNLEELEKIFKYPTAVMLSSEEKNMVWKYRYYIRHSRFVNSVAKFVKSVDWTEGEESNEALKILQEWEGVGLTDCLEILGSMVEENNNGQLVQYVVKRLGEAKDEDLMLVLLQLVQAIRTTSGHVAQLLIQRALANKQLCVRLYWHLMVESEAGNPDRKIYGKVAYQLMTEMVKSDTGIALRDMLRRQSELVQKLTVLSETLNKSKEPRTKKIKRLVEYIKDPKNKLETFEGPPLELPLDPDVAVVGIVAEKAMVFKSTMNPILIVFRTADGGEYSTIYKTGDDMRQDQLVLQAIELINTMLLRESLDLGLITYRVLATGTAQGFTQFVPSQSLAAVLSDHNNSIAQYLRQISTSDTSFAELMENYVKSCAGYCVITYILAVGDRHLDNLLLTRAGKLFHVDYGYILGNDPKPFPPPMKLCKEMAEAMMIDPSLVWYRKFRSASFMAYSILRKVDNFNLIYNLFRLMSTASSGLPDLTAEPDRALKVIEDRYRLDLTDDLAVQYLQSVISDSINALFPQVIETIHKWAQYWRS